MRRIAAFVVVALLCLGALGVQAEDFSPVALKFDRPELESRWRARLQSFLDAGVIPLIDMETSLQQDQVETYIPDALPVMDKLGFALIAADGYQRAKDGSKGYRWSTYIRALVNDYPDRFVPTANGGTNPNWLKEKGGEPTDFIDQMEQHVRAGIYANMGEFDFRHYMSNHQCKQGKTDRDSDIALTSENGHRVFRLSAKTGVPFVIHLEPEDQSLDDLATMLKQYPGANVIVAHFGQIRHPEKETRFTPETVRQLLGTYPNLYYDLATAEPNRRYQCSDVAADGVIWDGPLNDQRDTLSPAYKVILSEFSSRFVAATDYGGGREPWPRFLSAKAENLRRIMQGLPDEAQHNIGYRNAWKLLTGKPWAP